MISNFFLKLFLIFTEIIDYKNKSKVIKYLKNKLKKTNLVIFDIGAHKGETIDLFLKNFHLKKIYSFEPNTLLFKLLEKKYLKRKSIIEVYNLGIGETKKSMFLNIMTDTSSSTFNEINKKSAYFLRKEKIFKYFSKKKNLFEKKQNITVETLSNVLNEKKITNIDLLKIDTEGFEYNVLKGLSEQDFKMINFIYFEHHFDLMIKKNYKYSDIDQLLKRHNFFLSLKIKMNCRKSFEYIYEKKS